MTPWTVAHQAPLSLGFSRQEYWSGLPYPPPGDGMGLNAGSVKRFFLCPWANDFLLSGPLFPCLGNVELNSFLKC